MRGYFEVGIYHPKTEMNIGTLWRSAYQLGASGIFTIGRRYKKQSSDTLGVMNQIPLRDYETWEDFCALRPRGAVLVGVEMGGQNLSAFTHPRCAVYLLGAEDHGLPDKVRNICNRVVSIEAERMESYNVSVAGSIVMWHRLVSSFGRA